LSLTKKVYLTISGYDIKLSDNLTFYQKDQLKLIFYINEYGIDYENNATARALMPVNPLNAILFIENPEGVDSVSSAKIEDNAVTFYLDSTHTQYVGISRMQLRLFDQDGCAITLPHFTFEIRENIYGSGDVRFQNVVMVDQTGTVILTEDNDMLDVGDILTIGPEVPYPQVTKTIKELPIKHGLDGTEKLIVEDNEATKQAPLGTIVDEIKQNSQEKIREIESELAQTNAQLSQSINYVTYEMFGALGDGLTNDYQAIYNTHIYANANRISVVANAEKTYYIADSPLTIPIKTNVNFNGAKFIIDDTVKLTNTMTPLFTIERDDLPKNLTTQMTINRSVRQVDALKGYGDCLVEVVNTNKKQYIRKGNNANSGSNQQDYFICDNDGNILSQVLWDFNDITSVIVYPIEKNILKVENGHFTRIHNNLKGDSIYHERGILIKRSNVVIENVSCDVRGDTGIDQSPYNGFIHTDRCAYFKLANCFFKPIIYSNNSSNVAMGTYQIRIDRTLNATLENIHSISSEPERWGSYTSNYSKDVVIKNCELTRVDVHEGACNLTITDSILGRQGIQVVGHGTLNVQRCQMFGGSNGGTLLTLRSDYGSSWDGKVVLKDIVFHVGNINYRPKIINFANDGTHDFGYDCYYPEVEMENIIVDDSGTTYKGFIYLFNNERGNTSDDVADTLHKYPYYIKSKMSFKNMRVTSGEGFKFAYTPLNLIGEKESNIHITNIDAADNSNAFKELSINNNLTVSIDNVEFKKIENPTYGSSHLFNSFDNVTYDLLNSYWKSGDKVICRFNIKNCNDIHASVLSTACNLCLDNCVIRQLIGVSGGTLSKGYANNCIFLPPTMTTVSTIIRPNLMDFSFNRCEFRNPTVNNQEVTTKDDLCNIYWFLNEFRMKDSTHMKVRCRLTDCRFYSTLPINVINSAYQVCNFTLTDNINFTYYFRRHGGIGDRPNEAKGYTIPIGHTYYSTTDNTLYTWNGTNWI
jgi:hypothetical protein